VTTDIETNPAVAAYQKEIERADESALALKRQIEALHNSEQIQRQRLEQAQYDRQVRLMQMQPPSREQKIEAWKQAGLSPANEEFMWAHPELIDHHEVTRIATQEALASGVKPDSEDFRRAVKNNFDTAMRHLKAQAEHAEPTPSFFAPPDPKPAEPATIRSALVSAPTSREIPSGDRALSIPSRVSLSVEERQIAAASGISDKEYAANKLKMMHMKQRGEIQG
jgi:hypothetical protein